MPRHLFLNRHIDRLDNTPYQPIPREVSERCKFIFECETSALFQGWGRKGRSEDVNCNECELRSCYVQGSQANLLDGPDRLSRLQLNIRFFVNVVLGVKN